MPDSGSCDAISYETGTIAGVEMLPLGLSDEDAIARAHTLFSKRKRLFDGLEVWDSGRFVIRHPDPFAAKPPALAGGDRPHRGRAILV
jgi:hypothetical protein